MPPLIGGVCVCVCDLRLSYQKRAEREAVLKREQQLMQQRRRMQELRQRKRMQQRVEVKGSRVRRML